MLRYLFVIILLGSMAPLSSYAKQVPPKPNRLVVDYAGVLSRAEFQALERKLEAYNDSTSTQIAVVLDKSLEGEDPFEYSYRIAEQWGIGQRGKDNGVLIYVAVEDHKIFIQTGSNVEGALPDAIVKRIIENVLVPKFRRGRFYQGLSRATTMIMGLLSGEFSMNTGGEPFPMEAFVFLFLFLIAVIAIVSYLVWRCKKTGNCGDDDGGGYYRGGTYRSGRGGRWIIGGGSFGGGGFSGGGGFGGGGFGGFGGGGFSGGGAGGSW